MGPGVTTSVDIPCPRSAAGHVRYSVAMHIYAYNAAMEFEFDPEKARINLEKHGIDFADVEPVFLDEQAFTNRSDRETALGTIEERYITTGRDACGRIITVAWTPRGLSVRLISARHSRDEEKKDYERE